MAGKLQVKSDSEIQSLQERLDQLEQDRARRQTAATTDLDKTIADVRSQLDQAARVAFEARQAEQERERAAVAQELRDTETAIVETIHELQGLLAALDERQKAAFAAGVKYTRLGVETSTLLPNSGLAAVLGNVERHWLTYRRELVPNAPAPETRERYKVRECEGEYAGRKDAFAAAVQRVETYDGNHNGQVFREIMGRVSDMARALTLSQQRLLQAYTNLGDQATDDDRRRMAEVQDDKAPAMTMTF